MKRKLFIAISALMVLGLATAIFAFSQRGAFASFSGVSSKSCCEKKDSCPMKGNHAGDKKDACCNDCCKDGKCDMKKHGENAAACCDNCQCCGDSCPMKKKDGQTTTQPVAVSITNDGESCCGCDCCKKS